MHIERGCRDLLVDCAVSISMRRRTAMFAHRARSSRCARWRNGVGRLRMFDGGTRRAGSRWARRPSSSYPRWRPGRTCEAPSARWPRSSAAAAASASRRHPIAPSPHGRQKPRKTTIRRIAPSMAVVGSAAWPYRAAPALLVYAAQKAATAPRCGRGCGRRRRCRRRHQGPRAPLMPSASRASNTRGLTCRPARWNEQVASGSARPPLRHESPRPRWLDPAVRCAAAHVGDAHRWRRARPGFAVRTCRHPPPCRVRAGMTRLALLFGLIAGQ